MEPISYRFDTIRYDTKPCIVSKSFQTTDSIRYDTISIWNVAISYRSEHWVQVIEKVFRLKIFCYRFRNKLFIFSRRNFTLELNFYNSQSYFVRQLNLESKVVKKTIVKILPSRVTRYFQTEFLTFLCTFLTKSSVTFLHKKIKQI